MTDILSLKRGKWQKVSGLYEKFVRVNARWKGKFVYTDSNSFFNGYTYAYYEHPVARDKIRRIHITVEPMIVLMLMFRTNIRIRNGKQGILKRYCSHFELNHTFLPVLSFN